MSEEKPTIETEIVSTHPTPKIDLRMTKSATFNEKVSELMSKTGLERWQVEGIMGDLVAQNRSKESQLKIANRWGVAFGEVTTCRNMGKLTIDECREALGTKSIILANRALDALADDFNDPAKLCEMKPKDKLSIAKQMTDNALNLENKAVTGVGGVTNVNIGDVQVLIQHRAEREKIGGTNAIERLLAKGLNKELVEKAHGG